MISVPFPAGPLPPLCSVIAVGSARLLGLMHHEYRWSGVTGLLGGLATPSSVALIHPFWAASPFVSLPPPLCVIL